QQQIMHDTATDRRQRGEDQCPKQRVLAAIRQNNTGEGERRGAHEGENAEPLTIECLVGQHRQGVQIGDAAKFTAAAASLGTETIWSRCASSAMKTLTRSSAYTNPATTPRRNFCRVKVSSICSIERKGYRPLAPLGRIRTSVSVRYGVEKYAYRLRASLAVAPAAMSAVPAESAARWSSQAISGSRISTLMMRASARSISTS